MAHFEDVNISDVNGVSKGVASRLGWRCRARIAIGIEPIGKQSVLHLPVQLNFNSGRRRLSSKMKIQVIIGFRE